MKIFPHLLFLLCFSSRAQNLDSLWSVYTSKTLPDSVRLDAIDNIAWSYIYDNPDTAIILARQQLQLARSGGYKRQEGNALKTIGVANKNKGNYPEALECYLKALRIRQDSNDKKGMGACYTSMGSIYYYQSDYPKALEYYLKALDITETIGDKQGEEICNTNIGLVYWNQSEYPKALEYYLKGLKLSKETEDKQGEGNCYTYIGNVYYSQSNFAKALEYHFKALNMKKENNDNRGMGICYTNIALALQDQLNYPLAMGYYLKSLAVKREIDDKQGMGICFVDIGSLCNTIGNYKQAIAYGDSALRISTEIGDIDNKRLAYQNLATAYSKTGRYKEAYENHVQYKILTDSIFNADNSRQLSDMKTKFEVDKKEAELQLRAESEKAIHAEEKKRQQIVIYGVVSVLLIVFLFSIFLYRRFKITQRQKTVIEQQKFIVEEQKQEVEKQKHLVEEHQKEIIDSITYANRLQQAILPPTSLISQHLPDTFIYYNPKDIVAGDFYWMEHFGDLTLIAVADSTGHGVPGCMVSVVCSNALNRAVKEFGLRDTGMILDKTRELVLETFAKSGEEIKDGMDISLCGINTVTHSVQWSGANNQLWYIKHEGTSMTEIKADKQPIGKTDNPKPFTTHVLELQKGDIIYLMTDGYPDQFGGEKGKKFKYKQLEDNLVANSSRELTQQKNMLSESFDKWKGSLEQVDDVTIIGIKI